MNELLNSPWLLPAFVFIAVSIGVWAVSDLFVKDTQKANTRLNRIRKEAGLATISETETGQSGLGRLIKRATPVLADSIAPKTEKEANVLKERLSKAGQRSENAQSIYLSLKIVFLAVGTFLGLSGAFFFGDGSALNWAMGAGFGLIMFFMPDFILGMKIKKRQETIVLSMPDALDLLVVCVEAGLGLDQAMIKVSEEMRGSSPILSKEISTTNGHLQLGRTREDALKDLSDRNGVEDLTSLTQMLIQADRFGTSIADALRVQSDALRIRRRQRAEEKASKTAVQLLFPLVLFIFPGIFVVLVGPAAINIVDKMLTVN